MAFSVTEIPLAELRPAPWNANEVPPETLGKIRASIEDFGVVESGVDTPAQPDGQIAGPPPCAAQ